MTNDEAVESEVEPRVVAQEDVAHESKRGGRWSPFLVRVGDVIGDLTVVAEYERDSSGSRVLVFRCECGSSFARRGSLIMKRLREGRTPACRECTLRLRLLDRELHAGERRYFFRKLWYNTGRLYSRQHDEWIQAKILEDLESEIAPRRDVDAEAVQRWGFWSDPTQNEDLSDPQKTRRDHARAEADFLRDLREERAKRLEAHQQLAKHARVVEASSPRPNRERLTRTAPVETSRGPYRGRCPCESGELFSECHGRDDLLSIDVPALISAVFGGRVPR